MTRPRKGNIVVNVNTIGGKPVDYGSRQDGRIIVYDAGTDSYKHVDPVSTGFVQYPSSSEFPATGEANTLYYDSLTGTTYLWNSQTSTYVKLSVTVTFSEIKEKPNTLEGYGIINAWDKTAIGDPTTDYVSIFNAALL
jgi:hypothetical protein